MLQSSELVYLAASQILDQVGQGGDIIAAHSVLLDSGPVFVKSGPANPAGGKAN